MDWTARRTPLWWTATVLAGLSIGWAQVEALDNFSLLGEHPSSTPSRVSPLVFGVAAAIGVTWALWLRYTRHDHYLAIVLGGTRDIAGTVDAAAGR